MDKQPPSVQKQLIRLLYHTHYNNFESPGIVGSLDFNKSDIFLAYPQIDFPNKTLQTKELNANNSNFQQQQQQPLSQEIHAAGLPQNIHNQQTVGI